MSRTAVLVAAGGILWELLRTGTPAVGAAFDGLRPANASAAPVRPEREPVSGAGAAPPQPPAANDTDRGANASAFWGPLLEHLATANNRTRDWWGTWTETLMGSAKPAAPPDTWTWDGAPLVFFEFLVTWVGWALFGDTWHQVRSGFTRLVRIAAFLLAVVMAHYMFALAWPAVAIALALVRTVVWLLRSVVRLCGFCRFKASRWTGAVPEATGVTWEGPESVAQAGSPTLTAAFQHLKAEAARADGPGVVLRRGDAVMWVRPSTAQTAIRSPGLTLSIVGDFSRGADEALRTSLQGASEVRLCRGLRCDVEPELQHFKSYAVAAPEELASMEAFQLRHSVEESMQNLSSVGGACRMGWN